MTRPITQEELKLFNKHFIIKRTYAIQYLEKLLELPHDFYQNRYLGDLNFEEDDFHSEVIDDSGRTFICSKNTGEEFSIDDINDIVEFIQNEMPQTLKEEALYEENKPKSVTFTNFENKNTKDYQPVTQI